MGKLKKCSVRYDKFELILLNFELEKISAMYRAKHEIIEGFYKDLERSCEMY